MLCNTKVFRPCGTAQLSDFSRAILRTATALLTSIFCTPAAAVIFPGKNIDIDMRLPDSPQQTTWSAHWQPRECGLTLTTTAPLVTNTSDAPWLMTHPITLGEGARLGTGFSGFVSFQFARCGHKVELTSTTLTCETRIAEDADTWSPWDPANLESVCQITSGESAPTRRTAPTQDTTPHDSLPPPTVTFTIIGNLNGPTKQGVIQLLAKHGLQLTTTTLHPADAYSTIPENHHFALSKLPPEVPRPPAGYLQIRVHPQTTSPLTISQVTVNLSLLISGLKQ